MVWKRSGKRHEGPPHMTDLTSPNLRAVRLSHLGQNEVSATHASRHALQRLILVVASRSRQPATEEAFAQILYYIRHSNIQTFTSLEEVFISLLRVSC